MIIVCACGAKNRVPDTTTTRANCGKCKAMLFEVITCAGCGSKNRVPARATVADCGKCQRPLATSGDPSWSAEFINDMRERLARALKGGKK